MQRFLYTKKREIKMQWKYVVLQYLVLGPGLEPQVLVNITGLYSASYVNAPCSITRLVR